jgi:hypothetical protein
MDVSVGGLTVGGAYEQKLSQTFVAGASGLLAGAAFPLSCSGPSGPASGQVVLEVRSVVAGLPGDSALTSVAVAASAFPSFWPDNWPPTMRQISFLSPIAVLAGQSYSLVLQYAVQADGSSCAVLQGPVGNPYSPGSGFFIDLVNGGYGVPWYPLGDRDDLPFQTFVSADSAKMLVLHKGQWLCVDQPALVDHLSHGDTRGSACQNR